MAKNRAAEKAAEQILYGQFETEKKKTPFLENRALAIGLTVAAILLGTIFGCHRSVASQAGAVEKLFSDGIAYKGYSIAGDLSDRMDYAQNLTKIAQRYDLSAEAAEVSDAVNALRSADGTAETFDANFRLSGAVETLNGAMQNAALSEQDESYRLEHYRNFVSCNDTIAREADLYNEKVREFNDRVLGAFPTGTLAKLTGVRELEAFE